MQPFLGAAEGVQPPTPAAIVNAIYNGVGIRLQDVPFTLYSVKQRLQ